MRDIFSHMGPYECKLSKEVKLQIPEIFALHISIKVCKMSDFTLVMLLLN